MVNKVICREGIRREQIESNRHIRCSLIFGSTGTIGVNDRIRTILNPRDTMRGDLRTAGNQTLNRGNAIDCGRVYNISAMREIANGIMNRHCRVGRRIKDKTVVATAAE